MAFAKIKLGYADVFLQREFEYVIARFGLALAPWKIAQLVKLPDVIGVHDYHAHFFFWVHRITRSSKGKK
jgi:hypothetical protein